MVAPTDEVKDRTSRCTWADALCTENVDLTSHFLQFINRHVRFWPVWAGSAVLYSEAKITWTYDAWCIILLSLC
jgi:hypothetical protein